MTYWVYLIQYQFGVSVHGFFFSFLFSVVFMNQSYLGLRLLFLLAIAFGVFICSGRVHAMASSDLQEHCNLKVSLKKDLEEDLDRVCRCVSSAPDAKTLIITLKRHWAEFSKVSTSLRTVYSCLGDSDAVRRLRTERKLLAARIEVAIMDLNDTLRGLGEVI